jgi:hypothetical protein
MKAWRAEKISRIALTHSAWVLSLFEEKKKEIEDEPQM